MPTTFSPAEYDILMKTVILGDSGVGKSSLLHRYTENDWNPTYIATIGVDFKIDTFEAQGKVVKLQMWDTAGQERFKTICAAYYRGAHSIILVYDVTDRESFEHIRNWMKEVEAHARPNIPMVLLGNKADVPVREVETAEAEAFAERFNMKYIETSAKTAANVSEAFRLMVDNALEKRMEHLVVEDEDRKRRIQLLRVGQEDVRRQTCVQRFLARFGM